MDKEVKVTTFVFKYWNGKHYEEFSLSLDHSDKGILPCLSNKNVDIQVFPCSNPITVYVYPTEFYIYVDSLFIVTISDHESGYFGELKFQYSKEAK